MRSRWPLIRAWLVLSGMSALAGCRQEELPATQRGVSSSKMECPQTRGAAKDVELADLSIRPAAHEGKFIQVEGYYYDYFEHSALHPEPEAGRYGGDFNTQVWIHNIDHEYSGQRVRLRGVFTSKSKGHLGQWPGTLCVVSVLKLPSPGD